MKYTIREINDGIATIDYADGAWATILMTSSQTEAQLDDLANEFATKTGVKPSWAVVDGAERTAAAASVDDPPPPVWSEEERLTNPAWLTARQDAYGTSQSQLEYITENGLEAWQEHVAAIKLTNPIPE